MKDETFGEYITQLRYTKRLSQRKLAEFAGLTNSTISRIESNQVKPDPITLEKIAQALNIDKSVLMTKCGYSEIPEEFIVIARKAGELTGIQRAEIFKKLNATIDQFLSHINDDEEE